MGCAGCEARDQEIQYLREQNSGLIDRLMAVSSPQALAQIKGGSGVPVAPAVESFVDDQGQAWVTVQGKSVPLEKWSEMMKDATVALPNGQLVPETEAIRAFNKLDEMTGGRA